MSRSENWITLLLETQINQEVKDHLMWRVVNIQCVWDIQAYIPSTSNQRGLLSVIWLVVGSEVTTVMPIMIFHSLQTIG